MQAVGKFFRTHSPNRIMDDLELKRKIIGYVKENYVTKRRVPSVGNILDQFNINRRTFYQIFPRKQMMCEEASVPYDEDSFKKVEKATIARKSTFFERRSMLEKRRTREDEMPIFWDANSPARSNTHEPSIKHPEPRVEIVVVPKPVPLAEPEPDPLRKAIDDVKRYLEDKKEYDAVMSGMKEEEQQVKEEIAKIEKEIASMGRQPHRERTRPSALARPAPRPAPRPARKRMTIREMIVIMRMIQMIRRSS